MTHFPLKPYRLQSNSTSALSGPIKVAQISPLTPPAPDYDQTNYRRQSRELDYNVLGAFIVIPGALIQNCTAVTYQVGFERGLELSRLEPDPVDGAEERLVLDAARGTVSVTESFVAVLFQKLEGNKHGIYKLIFLHCSLK